MQLVAVRVRIVVSGSSPFSAWRCLKTPINKLGRMSENHDHRGEGDGKERIEVLRLETHATENQ